MENELWTIEWLEAKMTAEARDSSVTEDDDRGRISPEMVGEAAGHLSRWAYLGTICVQLRASRWT